MMFVPAGIHFIALSARAVPPPPPPSPKKKKTFIDIQNMGGIAGTLWLVLFLRGETPYFIRLSSF